MVVRCCVGYVQIQYDQGSVQHGLRRVGVGQDATLIILKTIHTIIWIVMTTANFVGFYFAFIGRFNWLFFLCVALLGGEIVVIIVNRWHCPLTDVMAQYTVDRRPNFDIYLPEWLARNNIKIFSVLLAVEGLIVLFHRIVMMS
jgi:hypothetical protein